MGKLTTTNPPQANVLRTKYADYIVVTQEEVTTRQFSLSIPSLLLLFVVLAFILFFSLKSTLLSVTDSPSNININESSNSIATKDNVNTMSNLKTTGFIFSDSDIRYLTGDDIDNLDNSSDHSQEQLVQYAINEIYARNHYKFRSENIYKFYNQFSWYSGYLDAGETVARFNEYEQSNVDFLAAIIK
jgi:hypothetical protein